MLVKLIEIRKDFAGGTASLNEIYINSSHIISITEDLSAKQNLVNEVQRLGLVENVRFSKIIISEGNSVRTITAVGMPSEINGKIRKRQILRG
tara:strand:+ start:258 stop:536 length:279 start_codon:yes stop_codon:yes gene_type:complete